MELYHFSEIVFPIIKILNNDDGSKKITQFLGTGFFIGDAGYFLTAKHVLSTESRKIVNFPEDIVIILTIDNEHKVFQVISVENGVDDVSIGKINYKPYKFFNITDKSKAYGWDDIYSFGYPENIVLDGTKYNVNKGQFLKGYITRILIKGENLGTTTAPHGYALSYSMPLGMSGSPIFKFGPEHDLIGICLGSYTSSVALNEVSEYESHDKYFKETINRVVEYGIGLSIIEIKDWQIYIADGEKLNKLF